MSTYRPLFTAAVVRDISSGLLSIHGQHDSQSLTNPALHLGLLDQYAQNRDSFAEYYRRYRELLTVKRQLDALNANESDNQRSCNKIHHNCIILIDSFILFANLTQQFPIGYTSGLKNIFYFCYRKL